MRSLVRAVSSKASISLGATLGWALALGCGWGMKAEDVGTPRPAEPAPAAAAPAPVAPAPAPAAVPAPAPAAVPLPTGSTSDELRVFHILAASQEEAQAFRKEIEDAGGDFQAFAAEARKKSKDVATKVINGDLGWVSGTSGLDRNFADAMYRLKLNEVSQPVQSAYGWHLILVKDRREKVRPASRTETKAAAEKTPTATPAGPNDLTPPAPATPISRAEAKRLPVMRDPSLRVTLMTAKALRLQPQQFTFLPDQAVEVELTVLNEGAKATQFFARELLPLGLTLTPVGETTPIEADFSSLAEPANFLSELKPYEISGYSVNLDDVFKSLGAKRYRVGWEIRTFLTNLEKRFPNVKGLPDYTTLSDTLKKPQTVTTDAIVRDTSPRLARSREITFSIFEDFKPEKNYYAQILLYGETEPLTISLNFKSQFQAARHFASLVLEGFYDNLDFFDVEPGDYVLGGDPLRTGTGAPNGTLPILSNTAKLEHKRGTVSFITRSIRQKGPVQGGQAGSIFVVCLKPHPEWDDIHVPFGEVVSGLDILEKKDLATRPRLFRKVTLLTEDEYRGGPSSTAPSVAGPLGNPQAIIKTSKGNIGVELFEDVARNTAINFVRLATDGFYDKDAKGDGKQKFIFVQKDANGKPLWVQTGSPTNDFEGGPGYTIRSEKNQKKCIRGALVMALQADPSTGRYLPDTAGSQFFILTADAPYLEYQDAITVFGQVTSGLDVLDKIGEGDTLESVEITKKKGHPYMVQKVR